MKRLLTLALIVGALIFAFSLSTEISSAEPPPPRPEQPRPDTFQWNGASLQPYSPVAVLSKANRAASYRIVVEPGCVAGTIPDDLARAEAEFLKVGFLLYQVDATASFIVHINCGSEQIRICGGVNIFCLNRSFPYSSDMDISDVLSTYYPETRLAILMHELMHAIATWGEQYALCGADCGFAASPNWRDIMNTGPLSRHGLETIELERWARTMYELTVPLPEWDDASCTIYGGSWIRACYNNWKSRWAGMRVVFYEFIDGRWECVAECQP